MSGSASCRTELRGMRAACSPQFAEHQPERLGRAVYRRWAMSDEVIVIGKKRPRFEFPCELRSEREPLLLEPILHIISR